MGIISKQKTKKKHLPFPLTYLFQSIKICKHNIYHVISSKISLAQQKLNLHVMLSPRALH